MATGSLNSLAKCTMVGVFTQGGETVFSLAQVCSSDYNTLILRITCNAHGKDGLLRSCKLAYFSTTDVTRGYVFFHLLRTSPTMLRCCTQVYCCAYTHTLTCSCRLGGGDGAIVPSTVPAPSSIFWCIILTSIMLSLHLPQRCEAHASPPGRWPPAVDSSNGR